MDVREITDARGLLRALDLDGGDWPHGDPYRFPWIFRGQADARWGLLPRAWRDDTATVAFLRPYRARFANVGFDARDAAIRNLTEQLWVQTSEGPRGTRHKLFILASRVSVETSTRASAHPTPHIVICH